MEFFIELYTTNNIILGVIVMDEMVVYVRRQYDDYRIAKYYFKDVWDIDWDDESGGVHTKSPGYLLYGYVKCNGMIEGEIAHSGALGVANHGPCPHDIKVCILKKDNDPEVIKHIINEIGDAPSKFDYRRKHWCITDIKDILRKNKKPIGKWELLGALEQRGHTESAMLNALKKHKDEIIKSRCDYDRRCFEYRLKEDISYDN